MNSEQYLLHMSRPDLVRMLQGKEAYIISLQERIQELENERERRASWEKDSHGVLRCSCCGSPAPKTVRMFYDGRVRVRTPYCMKCGSRMEDRDGAIKPI